MKHGWHCIWMSMLNVWLLVDMTTHTLIDRIVTDSSNQPAEIKNERAAPLCHPKESLSYDAVDNAHAADCSWLQEFACDRRRCRLLHACIERRVHTHHPCMTVTDDGLVMLC
jgi:hypothetical protein